ncbi:hypothetical protein IWW34DRAFT_40461 [Fusarium oxysporum f. sp. albedinis]|nr:hypothetical protein IWW34DRAFT_40461 [Fusarium oxysporum f. sp. albedinis]
MRSCITIPFKVLSCFALRCVADTPFMLRPLRDHMPKRGHSFLCIGSWVRHGFRKRMGVFPFWWLIVFGATEPNLIYPSGHHFVLLSCFQGCCDEAWGNTACDCTLMYMRRTKRGQKM